MAKFFLVMILHLSVRGRGKNILPCIFCCMANNEFTVRFFFVVCPIKMHGKEATCRAPEIKRTTKSVAHDKGEFSGSA
jgi:hypothetical protein